MKESILGFATFAVRVAGSTSLALLIAQTTGCVAQSDQEPEVVGEAQSAMSSTYVSFLSQTDLNGTSLPPNTSCFLSGLFGNLNEGEQWYGGSRVSEAGPSGSLLHAHGGAYDPGNTSDLPAWANNTVGSRAVCIPNASVTWVNEETLTVDVTSPGTRTTKTKRLADLDPSGHRQCWLTYLSAVAGTWVQTGSFAKVRAVTVTDTLHPSTGWYIDAYLTQSNYGHAKVTATCWDIPGATDWGTYPVTSLSGQFGQTTISPPDDIACGLTEITGDFTDNWGEDGVYLVPPVSPSQDWKLKAYGGKSGKAVCVR